MSAREVIAEELERYTVSPGIRAESVIAALRAAGYVIMSPDEVRGIRDAALEEAAETVRKMIPIIPHDGPSTPMQEIEYTSLGFAMTAIRSMKGGRDAQ